MNFILKNCLSESQSRVIIYSCVLLNDGMHQIRSQI